MGYLVRVIVFAIFCFITGYRSVGESIESARRHIACELQLCNRFDPCRRPASERGMRSDTVDQAPAIRFIRQRTSLTNVVPATEVSPIRVIVSDRRDPASLVPFAMHE